MCGEIFLRKTLSERYSPQGGAGDLSRTGSVAGGLGGIVSGGFLKLGYIPVSQVRDDEDSLDVFI